MKNIKKVIVSAMAAVMAAAALATTAGAAEYYGYDGSYAYDGINDGISYAECSDGSWYVADNTTSYSYDYDLYNNFYRRTDSGACTATYTSYTRNYKETYVGCDSFYGNIYYRSDIGYYSSSRTFGQSFTFTEYVGTDRYGRKIYYRSEHGYIYYSGKGNVWYTLGYNYNNIAW